MKYAKMLDGRYALILGGDTDVGAAVARAFAAHGARVAVADAFAADIRHAPDVPHIPRSPDVSHNPEVPRTSGAPHASSAPDIPHVPDIPDALVFATPMVSSAMQELCSAVLASFPYVDILVGATGPYKTGATRDFPASDLRSMLDSNLGCAVKCFQRLLPGMLERRRGELILFAPDLADAGMPGAAAAAACAGAIASFARNVTNDYIRYRVRANAILYPFDGACGRAPLSGAPEPADAANAALWYACYLSRFVTGERLNLNGGLAYVNTRGGASRA